MTRPNVKGFTLHRATSAPRGACDEGLTGSPPGTEAVNGVTLPVPCRGSARARWI